MRLTLLLALAHSVIASPWSIQEDVVDLGYAKYLGNRAYSNSVAYLGIPYAEPPLGDLRFRAPLPLNTERVKAATGGRVVNATAYPDFCVQGALNGQLLLFRP